MSEKSKVKSGKIGVQSDNMFPIIKKFLYSDNEIFLREIVSNGVDAVQKLRTLANKGEYTEPLGELHVEVKIEDDKLIISDNGVGMTADEIERYINQIAISGAEEFVEKYKDDVANIIGHFGLGFYSSFMVADKVEIYTQSYRSEEPSIRWSCLGEPEFEMDEAEKRPRGTDIIIYIDEESKEYLEPTRIQHLLTKYCHFLPVPIFFGKEKEWKDGKHVETDRPQRINDTEPIWTKQPTELNDEDYEAFYQALFPMSETPLFWVHLNIDYPFDLTGILYFPKIKGNMDIQKHKIQLYSNQVFVTDSVEGIVPEFLTLLHGVLDSPDIPLNVSRSYLQADHNVKKISNYITRKVADKLQEIFKEDRKSYEEKWEVLDLFVKYGMLTDEKFYEKAEKFVLLKDRAVKHYTLEEYRELIAPEQTDKEGKVVYLYAVDPEGQYSYIQGAEKLGYNVLLLDQQLDMHLVSMLEEKLPGTKFVRVDSATADNLIQKERDKEESEQLPDEQVQVLKRLFEQQIDLDKIIVGVDASYQGKEAKPLTMVQDEYMRRMKEMSAMQAGMSFYGTMPDSYTLSLNLDHPLVRGIAVVFENQPNEEYDALIADRKGYEARIGMLQQELSAEGVDDDAKKRLQEDLTETRNKVSELTKQINEVYKAFGDKHPVISQLIDLGLLSSGLLKGEELEAFLDRSLGFISQSNQAE